MQVYVPYNLRFLSDLIGEEACFSFIENVAGTRIWIPNLDKVKGSKLEETYGSQIAEALAKEKEGGNWEVPLYKDWRMRKLFQKGHSHNEIALRLGMTRINVVHNLSLRQTDIHEAKQIPAIEEIFPQLDMFQ